MNIKVLFREVVGGKLSESDVLGGLSEASQTVQHSGVRLKLLVTWLLLRRDAIAIAMLLAIRPVQLRIVLGVSTGPFIGLYKPI